MSLVLEITCTNLKVGNLGSKKPDLLGVEYQHSRTRPQLPPQYELNDHALAKEDRERIVSLFTPEMQALSDSFQKYYGTWLQLRDELWSKLLIQKLIYKALFQKQYSSKRVFVVDHDFSEKLKLAIYEIFTELRAKSVIFLPWSVLAVLGANVRNGLVLKYTFESLKIQTVVDLRVIDCREYVSINSMTKGDSTQQGNTENLKAMEKSEKLDKVQEIIGNIIRRSPIDIRKVLRENVIVIGDESNKHHKIDLTMEKHRFETRPSDGCWIACSLYSQIGKKWVEYKP